MERWEGGGREGQSRNQVFKIKYYQFKSSARVVAKCIKTATKFSLKIHIFWDVLMYW